MNAMDRDVFVIISVLNAYISIRVGMDDCEWSFGRGGGFAFFSCS